MSRLSFPLALPMRKLTGIALETLALELEAAQPNSFVVVAVGPFAIIRWEPFPFALSPFSSTFPLGFVARGLWEVAIGCNVTFLIAPVTHEVSVSWIRRM